MCWVYGKPTTKPSPTPPANFIQGLSCTLRTESQSSTSWHTGGHTVWLWGRAKQRPRTLAFRGGRSNIRTSNIPTCQKLWSWLWHPFESLLNALIPNSGLWSVQICSRGPCLSLEQAARANVQRWLLQFGFGHLLFNLQLLRPKWWCWDAGKTNHQAGAQAWYSGETTQKWRETLNYCTHLVDNWSWYIPTLLGILSLHCINVAYIYIYSPIIYSIYIIIIYNIYIYIISIYTSIWSRSFHPRWPVMTHKAEAEGPPGSDGFCCTFLWYHPWSTGTLPPCNLPQMQISQSKFLGEWWSMDDFVGFNASPMRSMKSCLVTPLVSLGCFLSSWLWIPSRTSCLQLLSSRRWCSSYHPGMPGSVLRGLGLWVAGWWLGFKRKRGDDFGCVSGSGVQRILKEIKSEENRR